MCFSVHCACGKYRGLMVLYFSFKMSVAFFLQNPSQHMIQSMFYWCLDLWFWVCLVRRLVELLLHRLKKKQTKNKTHNQHLPTPPKKVFNFTLSFSSSYSKMRDFVSSDRAAAGPEWGPACNITTLERSKISLALIFSLFPLTNIRHRNI